MTTRDLLNNAESAFLEGRFDEAERLLRSAVQNDPQNADTHVTLANLLTRTERHTEAADSYANAMRVERDYKGLALVYAVSCFRVGRYGEAEKSARLAIQLEPSGAAYDTLACALREQGKFADALAAVDDALRLNPTKNAAQHTKGTILLAMGRTAEALTIFEDLNNRGASAPAITMNRGAALEKLGRTAEAARLYTEATALWPNFPDLQRERAKRRN